MQFVLLNCACGLGWQLAPFIWSTLLLVLQILPPSSMLQRSEHVIHLTPLSLTKCSPEDPVIILPSSKLEHTSLQLLALVACLPTPPAEWCGTLSCALNISHSWSALRAYCLPAASGQKPLQSLIQLPACLQIFVIFLMHVHNAMPLSKQRGAVSQEPPWQPLQSHRSRMSSPIPADDTIVMDAPLAQWLRFHWPKYALWVALEALLLVIALRFQVAGGCFSKMLLRGPQLIGHVATCYGFQSRAVEQVIKAGLQQRPGFNAWILF